MANLHLGSFGRFWGQYWGQNWGQWQVGAADPSPTDAENSS